MAGLYTELRCSICFAAVASFLFAGEKHVVAGHCIYSTMTGYMYPYGAVTESYIIENFYGDCELLCFSNAICVAANVRILSNGSTVCEFR